ncbi:MAG: heavy metal translocating P-type ATPase, partial [Tardiphaga sp.]|nr:heavy metal translocating P-type ATPase [Tardiphaga sp.]
MVHKHGANCCGDHAAVADDRATDPVCGMKVDRATAKHRFSYNDEEYLFCCNRCRERFAADPQSFLKPKPEPAVADDRATDPVCGMKVDRATAKHRFSYNNEEYLFCCNR